jgi:hypothetical protein
MLKMVAGKPPNQILAIGLSFRNLEIFEKHQNDTYIRITRAETGLPIDVILASGSRTISGEGSDGAQRLFVIQIGLDELIKLRQNPGEYIMGFEKDECRIPMNICIFSGETEAEMATRVTEFIGPNTKVITSQILKN